MTADHTPERLSAEERAQIEAGMGGYLQLQRGGTNRVRVVPERLPEGVIAAVERILAAHLADVEARLAAVEALADHWDEWLPVSLMASGRRVLDDIDVRDLTSELRAALHPPCTSKLMLRWGSDMCDNPEPRHTEHSHSASDHTWTDAEAEQSIKDRENL